jgi:hypothetical protein
VWHTDTLQYKHKQSDRTHAWRWVRGLLAGLILTAAAGGCVERHPPATPPATPGTAAGDSVDAGPAEPDPVLLGAEEQAQIRHLLDMAHWAMADDRLSSPYQGSAQAAYDQVLQIQSDQPEARRGLERIVERYLELALAAAARRQFTSAREMIDRAQHVDPDHPGIAPAQAQIRMLSAADRRVIALDGAQLRDQDQAVRNTLAAAGTASRRDGCRIEIFARSDAEGRWIYQQLSGGDGHERIRAQLNIGSPPRLELLCFSETS